MRAVIQRVRKSSVAVNGEIIANIGKGLMVLLGVSKDDTSSDADYLAKKIIHLRIFEDEGGKMNKSVEDTEGEILVVSQFTLYGDCRKGRRPSFINAARPVRANELYEYFVRQLRDQGISVQTGEFQAMMDVSLINDGPVTLIIESKTSE